MNETLPKAPARREQRLELAVFLLLIVPSLAQSLFVSGTDDGSFALVAVFTILRDAALLALLLFFLWRNAEPLASIGWKRIRQGREIAIGVALFLPIAFASAALEGILRSFGLSAPRPPRALMPGGGWQLVLAVLLVLVVAVTEETIFRGYLLLRFKACFGSTSWAVLLSAVIFALGHGYEGASGLITVGAFGAALALVYVWRGSLTAPITIHLLQDLLSVVVIPRLLAMGR